MAFYEYNVYNLVRNILKNKEIIIIKKIISKKKEEEPENKKIKIRVAVKLKMNKLLLPTNIDQLMK